jgi:hypothetical protein
MIPWLSRPLRLAYTSLHLHRGHFMVLLKLGWPDKLANPIFTGRKGTRFIGNSRAHGNTCLAKF